MKDYTHREPLNSTILLLWWIYSVVTTCVGTQVPCSPPVAPSYLCDLEPGSPTRVSLCNGGGSHPTSGPSVWGSPSSVGWWGWRQASSCPQTSSHKAYGTSWCTMRSRACQWRWGNYNQMAVVLRAEPHLGCPGRCCLLFGSRLTVSFSFSTASLLGQEPAISSSEGGPGSGNATTNVNLFSELSAMYFCCCCG